MESKDLMRKPPYVRAGFFGAAPEPALLSRRGKVTKGRQGVLRIPPLHSHNAPLLGLRPAAQASLPDFDVRKAF